MKPLLTLLIISMTTSVQAQGFIGPSQAEATHSVAMARKANDDAMVKLTGHIVKQISSEDYLFKDSSGEIEIEIESDKWPRNSITPETLVGLEGEVDKDWLEISVEVDQLWIIQTK